MKDESRSILDTLFPFHVTVGVDGSIAHVGKSMAKVMPDAVGQQHSTSASLGRPPVPPHAYLIACSCWPLSGARSTLMALSPPTCEMFSATHWPVCGTAVAPTSAEKPLKAALPPFCLRNMAPPATVKFTTSEDAGPAPE